MHRFSSFLNLFDAFWYMNNVFDLKHMIFDTNMITSKSVKFKHKLGRLRETGPRLIDNREVKISLRERRVRERQLNIAVVFVTLL